MDALIATVGEMLEGAATMEEFAERVRASFDDLGLGGIEETLALAMMAAHAGGRAQIESEGDDA